MLYGLLTNLTNRLTNAASSELVALSLLLQDFQLSDSPDERFLVHGPSFSSKAVYDILMQEVVEDDHADLIWRSRNPSKIKIFAWLLFRGRLNTRANLMLTARVAPRCPKTLYTCLSLARLPPESGICSVYKLQEDFKTFGSLLLLLA